MIIGYGRYSVSPFPKSGQSSWQSAKFGAVIKRCCLSDLSARRWVPTGFLSQKTIPTASTLVLSPTGILETFGGWFWLWFNCEQFLEKENVDILQESLHLSLFKENSGILNTYILHSLFYICFAWNLKSCLKERYLIFTLKFS